MLLQKRVSQKFTALWSSVKVLLIALPTFYRVEHSFSYFVQILTKDRSQLHVIESGDLLLKLSGYNP